MARLTKVTEVKKIESGSEDFEKAFDIFKKGIKVNMAFLHSSVMIPGSIGSETSLTPEKIPGISMSTIDNRLFIHLKDCIAILPDASIKAMIVKA